MTTIDKMDSALNIVHKYKHKRITLNKFIDEFMATFQITPVDLGGCIRILKEDGYIRKFVDEDEKEKLKDFPFQDEARQHYTFIVITMKGMLFKENGGYKGAKRDRLFTMIKNIAVTAITILIGIGTVWTGWLQYSIQADNNKLDTELSLLRQSLHESESTIQSQQYCIDSLKNILIQPLKHTTDMR